VLLWPGHFPMARQLTVGTALVSALLSGLVARAALGSADSLRTIVIAVVGTGLLTSVLARPDLAGRHRARRHRRHRPA
jgi:hypothetical protein